jgi:hypothetical protein
VSLSLLFFYSSILPCEYLLTAIGHVGQNIDGSLCPIPPLWAGLALYVLKTNKMETLSPNLYMAWVSHQPAPTKQPHPCNMCNMQFSCCFRGHLTFSETGWITVKAVLSRSPKWGGSLWILCVWYSYWTGSSLLELVLDATLRDHSAHICFSSHHGNNFAPNCLCTSLSAYRKCQSHDCLKPKLIQTNTQKLRTNDMVHLEISSMEGELPLFLQWGTFDT